MNLAKSQGNLADKLLGAKFPPQWPKLLNGCLGMQNMYVLNSKQESESENGTVTSTLMSTTKNRFFKIFEVYSI
jgi:hypothetical protein